MFKNLFNRKGAKSPDSFDQVTSMATERLTIPRNLHQTEYIQFIAKRDPRDYWYILSTPEIDPKHPCLEEMRDVYDRALIKHVGGLPPAGKVFQLNFDLAYLILRDLEHSFMKASGQKSLQEPEGHFRAAWRLLPEAFKHGLEDLYVSVNAVKGELFYDDFPRAPRRKKDSRPG